MKYVKLYEEMIIEGYFDLEDRDYIMYHGTPTRNVESIQKNGLRQSVASGSKFSESLAWFADSEELARQYGLARMKFRKEQPDTISVIVFKLNPKDEHFFKAMTKGIYTSRDVISPEKIVEILPGK